MKQTIWNHANDPKKVTANFLASRDERSTLLVQPERPVLAALLPPPPSLPVPSVKLSPIADPECWKTTLDPNTGGTLYWNETANVSTWETPHCLKATLEWKQQQAREKGLNELAAARKQLLGISEYEVDDHDRYFLDAPPGLSLPSSSSPAPTSTPFSAAPTTSKPSTTPPSTLAPKLTPDEAKKQKEKAAFAKWQERQQATKKPRLMASSIKKAQNAGALSAVAVAVKEKAETPEAATEASGPSLPNGRAAPALELKPKVVKPEVPSVSTGESCNACLAFGYKMVEVVTEVLGQTIKHHYCWDCVPGSEAAAKKARKPKRAVRIKGEGSLPER